MEQKRFPIFAERFAKLRGDMSQGDFAKFLGISRPTVGFYENGTRIPDALLLRQIAEKCCVSTDYLLGLTDYERTQTAELKAEDMGITDSAAKALAKSKRIAGGLPGALISGLAVSPHFYDLASLVANYMEEVEHAEKYAHTISSIFASEKQVRIKRFLVSEKLFDVLDDVVPSPNFKERMKKAREIAETQKKNEKT